VAARGWWTRSRIDILAFATQMLHRLVTVELTVQGPAAPFRLPDSLCSGEARVGIL
jgi:hypothetical protein